MYIEICPAENEHTYAQGFRTLPQTPRMFYQYFFCLFVDIVRQSCYFLFYWTPFDAANGNLPKFTKIHNGYHV